MGEFIDFLTELRAHDSGTYAAVNLDKKSSTALFKWVKANLSIAKPVPAKDYHTTVVYSKTGCAGIKNEDWPVPSSASINGWKILKHGDDRSLVLTLDAPQLSDMHDKIRRDYNATWDFPSYLIHVTVAYDYTGDLPTELPDLLINYDSVTVQGLKTDWRPEE